MSACLSISLITAFLFILSAASLQRNAGAGQYTAESNPADSVDSPSAGRGERQNRAASHPAGITLVIMNDSEQFPLAIKVGDQYIQLPGPSSWPRDADGGKSAATKGRFIAAIIDTADILKANGFDPDASFSFVMDDTEMDVNNTHRITAEDFMNTTGGGHRQRSGDDGMPAAGNGAWRALKFRNVIVGNGRIPALSDYLVKPQNLVSQNNSNKNATTAPNLRNSTFAPIDYRGDVPQVRPLEEPSPQNNRRYINALNSPNPAVRADAIENLLLNGYQEADADNSGDLAGTTVNEATADNHTTIDDKKVDSADHIDETLAQETLSGIALRDKSPAARIQALDQLVESFGRKASPTLKEAMHDPDPRVARTAGALMSDMEDADQ